MRIPNVCIESADAEEAIRRKIQAERDEMKAAAEADKDDDDEDDDNDDEQPLLFDKTFALKLWLTGSFPLFLSSSLASVRACVHAMAYSMACSWQCNRHCLALS